MLSNCFFTFVYITTTISTAAAFVYYYSLYENDDASLIAIDATTYGSFHAQGNAATFLMKKNYELAKVESYSELRKTIDDAGTMGIGTLLLLSSTLTSGKSGTTSFSRLSMSLLGASVALLPRLDSALSAPVVSREKDMLLPMFRLPLDTLF